ncbi:hypothetical protein Agub_g6178 [Astrephomene gubernaculifera]|uniref:Uncharacterized protein n=1 Tax=Astrephomene gubernaculifera TaxID=47775 RepID=A0AAD3DQ10_9CHLO|nr:hypothetical protein Agub_g6178 [Astrephomene gubernaculifera]
MVDLKTLAAEYDVNKQTVKSSCKFKIADNAGVKLKLTNPGNKLGLEFEGKTWSASYDVKTKDIEYERKWKSQSGEFKLKQKIPKGQIELVPSPEFQWRSHVVKGRKVAWEVQPSYCFQTRKAKLDQTLELGGGKHKIKLEMDSRAGTRGLTGTLTSRLDAGWARQLSVKYSPAAGASLTHELEPSKQVSLKSTVGLRARDLKLVAEVKPGKVAGVKPKLTLESRLTAKAPLRPSGIIAGLSLDC